ncbi:MAG: hypothetical protein HQK60_19295 [Deltaproteobacteria bacterium]|nr:hypothetical protein [Deltaproteobacteria bacterium]
MTTRPTYYKAICLVISLCLLGLGALPARTCCCTRYVRSVGSGDTGGEPGSIPPCCRMAGKAAPMSGIMADAKAGSLNWACSCACRARQHELYAEFTVSNSLDFSRFIPTQAVTGPESDHVTTIIPVAQTRTGGPPVSPPLYLLGSSLLC